MSYAQRKEISGNRTVAIVIVAIVHALLGYAIVTGLAFNVVKKVAEDLKTFDVEEEPPPPEEEPPPPEEEPPPPPDMPDVPPPPMQPPPIIRPPMVQQTIQQVETPFIPPAPPKIQPRPAPPPPPLPPPVRTVPPQSASGNLQGLITESDYPSQAISNDEQGTVTVSLSIGSNGRVTGCQTTSSSGSRTLDSATCRILRARARFTPARDNQGNPTSGSFSQRISWRLE